MDEKLLTGSPTASGGRSLRIFGGFLVLHQWKSLHSTAAKVADTPKERKPGAEQDKSQPVWHYQGITVIGVAGLMHIGKLKPQFFLDKGPFGQHTVSWSMVQRIYAIWNMTNSENTQRRQRHAVCFPLNPDSKDPMATVENNTRPHVPRQTTANKVLPRHCRQNKNENGCQSRARRGDSKPISSHPDQGKNYGEGNCNKSDKQPFSNMDVQIHDRHNLYFTTSAMKMRSKKCVCLKYWKTLSL